jgi:hypothetical protein
MAKEHVHEWVFDKMPMEIRCLTCPDTKMSLEEGERRLNATDRLSAEDAQMAAYVGKDNGLTEREVRRLKAYASSLKGEDG